MDTYVAKPGFQGSVNTGAEVIIYPQAGDPIISNNEAVRFTGRSQYDRTPALISATYTNQMGAASDQWSITAKALANSEGRELLDMVVDDDWVDLSFKVQDKVQHVSRGLIDSRRKSESVGGNGASTVTYTFSGRGFGKIWEATPIWFSPYSGENLAGSISQRVFSSMENNLGSPVDAVTAFLDNMLREIGDLGRATWLLPKSLPNSADGSFLSAYQLDYQDYPVDLANKLVGLSQNWLMPSGTLWQMAQEWSDPDFNELFTSIAPRKLNNVSESLRPTDSTMLVMFREKPFPTQSAGRNSLWFSLPTHNVPIQQCLTLDVGSDGSERFNAFFVSPQLTQEVLGQGGVDLMQPLWSPDDISRHGFRRYDVMSKYTSGDADLLTIPSEFREKIRDWYCLNPYFWSGSVSLRRMRPEIRVGERVRILEGRGQDRDRTYYVEQVSHTWQHNRGATSLNVTRGYPDSKILDDLGTVARNYVVPPTRTGLGDFSGTLGGLT